MPSALTSYGAGKFLAFALGIESIPANFYAALCSNEPGTDIDGTTLAELEPDPLLGYERIAVPIGSNWTDPSETGFSTNITAIDFGVPEGEWGVANYFALCTADVDGEVYLYGEFDVPAELDSSYNFSIPAGAVQIALESLFQPVVVT